MRKQKSRVKKGLCSQVEDATGLVTIGEGNEIPADLAAACRDNYRLFFDTVNRGMGPGGTDLITTDDQAKWIEQYTVDGTYTCIEAPPEWGKSVQFNHATVWLAGRDPNLTHAFCGRNAKQPKKHVRAVAMMIEGRSRRAQRIRQVFPNLRKHPTANCWGAEALIWDREGDDPTPSLQAVGAGGDIDGDRVDRLRGMDLTSYEDIYSTTIRDRKTGWWRMVATTRLTTTHGSAVIEGNARHVMDALRRSVNESGYRLLRTPAGRRVEKRAHPNTVRGEKLQHGTVVNRRGRQVYEWVDLAWPQWWTSDKLEERWKRLGGGAIAAASLLCDPVTAEGSEFEMAWWEGAFALGDLWDAMVADHPDRARQYRTHWLTATGGDTATGRHRTRGDLTAFLTGAALAEEFHGADRRLLHADVGRWNVTQQRDHCQRILDRYGRSHRLRIEEQSTGSSLVALLVELGHVGQVVGAFTGANKWDPVTGVRSVGIELDEGRWIIPRYEETERIAAESIAWERDKHTPDELMAFWLLIRELNDLSPRVRGELADGYSGEDQWLVDDDEPTDCYGWEAWEG